MRKLLGASCLAILAIGTYSLNHTWQRMEKAREVADHTSPSVSDFVPSNGIIFSEGFASPQFTCTIESSTAAVAVSGVWVTAESQAGTLITCYATKWPN